MSEVATRSSNCPQCGKSLRVKPELFGRKVACPGCKTTFVFDPERSNASGSSVASTAEPTSRPVSQEAAVTVESLRRTVERIDAPAETPVANPISVAALASPLPPPPAKPVLFPGAIPKDLRAPPTALPVPLPALEAPKPVSQSTGEIPFSPAPDDQAHVEPEFIVADEVVSDGDSKVASAAKDPPPPALPPMTSGSSAASNAVAPASVPASTPPNPVGSGVAPATGSSVSGPASAPTPQLPNLAPVYPSAARTFAPFPGAIPGDSAVLRAKQPDTRDAGETSGFRPRQYPVLAGISKTLAVLAIGIVVWWVGYGVWILAIIFRDNAKMTDVTARMIGDWFFAAPFTAIAAIVFVALGQLIRVAIDIQRNTEETAYWTRRR